MGSIERIPSNVRQWVATFKSANSIGSLSNALQASNAALKDVADSILKADCKDMLDSVTDRSMSEEHPTLRFLPTQSAYRPRSRVLYAKIYCMYPCFSGERSFLTLCPCKTCHSIRPRPCSSITDPHHRQLVRH